MRVFAAMLVSMLLAMPVFILGLLVVQMESVVVMMNMKVMMNHMQEFVSPCRHVHTNTVACLWFGLGVLSLVTFVMVPTL